MKAAADKVDAIVIGSGAAGSSMASRLAAGGKKVIILEAGPERNNGSFVSSQIWARRLRWSGAPVIEEGDSPVGHVFNAGYGVGGSAQHHFAVWPRFHADDFKLKSRYDRGLDWPISYSELRPWYDKMQEEYGISGDAEQETWRPEGAPYPMPGVPLFAQGKILGRGFEKLGMGLAPLPLAVTSQSYKGRPACIWDGWCDSGCPIGALANPLTVDLPAAKRHGAEIRSDATVSKVLTDASGDFASGVVYHDKSGNQTTLRADLVVLAAFSVQNPRLLLASATERHPAGLANSSGLVGKYVMNHPGALVYGLFDEETECHMGATGGQLLNQDGYDKRTHANKNAFGSYQWMIAQAVKPTDLLGVATTKPGLYGNELHEFLQVAMPRFAGMTAVIEDLPIAENALTLAERTDHFGTPLARITHSIHPDTRALWDAVLAEGKRIFKAAGAREIWTGPQAAMHIMGGTIMGKDAQSSVCNEFGQTHDIPNLVVAGPGLFPTSAGVNPTFTVHALAARTSDHLLRNWSAIIA